jgi:peroxiredoxin
VLNYNLRSAFEKPETWRPEKMEDAPPPKPIEQHPANYNKDFESAVGLAIASLTLGILSLPLSIFIIGAGAGLAGLITAFIHLRKRRPFRTVAVWGLVLSLLGFLAGAGLGLYYGINIYQYNRQIDQLSTDGSDLILQGFIGAEAPDFTMTDIEGNQFTLSSLKGRRVVLNFWATWCPPCRIEIPQLINLRKEVHPNDLAIIGISDEDKQVLLEFAVDKNINYTIATANDLPAPYSYIQAIPTTFFINRQGHIQDILSGLSSPKEFKEKALAPDLRVLPVEPNLPVEY